MAAVKTMAPGPLLRGACPRVVGGVWAGLLPPYPPRRGWQVARASRPVLRSYYAELAALQAAAHWCAAMCDLWQLAMSARPTSVTVIGDNSSALQVAAGAGAALCEPASFCRVAWQTVQARISTHVRHVHSHVGVKDNTLADALATVARRGALDGWIRHPAFAVGPIDPSTLPWLWLIPQASFHEGRPVFVMCPGATDWVPATPDPGPASEAATPVLVDRAVHVLTANLQSIKDPRQNPFNPSGHGARRQHLYHQLNHMKADVVCLQETRAAAGRWSTGGWLSWRSGGIRGQYGCEVWLRPTQLDPPLTIQSCRILAADPRFIVVNCLDSRLPLTVCSAHAPHADRPAEEKAEFWRNLRAVLHRVPRGRSLCVGIDANADFCARDEGMSLIGELLGQHDMTSNDEYLFEFAMALGLEAPATWTHLQRGPGGPGSILGASASGSTISCLQSVVGLLPRPVRLGT